jgi:hypothetical protein
MPVARYHPPPTLVGGHKQAGCGTQQPKTDVVVPVFRVVVVAVGGAAVV